MMKLIGKFSQKDQSLFKKAYWQQLASFDFLLCLKKILERLEDHAMFLDQDFSCLHTVIFLFRSDQLKTDKAFSFIF